MCQKNWNVGMKIVFFDPANIDYSVATVYQYPLGGSQSAICYLGMNLASLGHDIFLVNKISTPTITHGVACLPINSVTNNFWQNVDFIICFNGAEHGDVLRKICGTKVNIILWNQHAHDQPAIQNLTDKNERESYDAFFMISDWQARNFINTFNLKTEKIHILRNSVGPSFNNLFDRKSSILEKQSRPISLAYTSAPYRGLKLLLNIFPKIHERFPDVTLKVFSSMQVYRISEEQEKEYFGEEFYRMREMYETLKEMDGVDYIGSIPQSDLAKELERVSILVYPNTFPETSCIAVMEAMASGCYIITSDLGALPETTAGFATLVPFNQDLEVYQQNFVMATIDHINYLQSANANDIEEKLNKQVTYCQQHYLWKERAQEWLEKLYEIRGYTFFKHQEYRIAIDFYQGALEYFPASENFCCYLIICLILSGLEDEALSVIMNAVINSKFSSPDRLPEKLNEVIEKESNFLTNANEGNAVKIIANFFSQLE
jgi:glycosyltransferase involved in cell wall biosynthesis